MVKAVIRRSEVLHQTFKDERASGGLDSWSKRTDGEIAGLAHHGFVAMKVA